MLTLMSMPRPGCRGVRKKVPLMRQGPLGGFKAPLGNETVKGWSRYQEYSVVAGRIARRKQSVPRLSQASSIRRYRIQLASALPARSVSQDQPTQGSIIYKNSAFFARVARNQMANRTTLRFWHGSCPSTPNFLRSLTTASSKRGVPRHPNGSFPPSAEAKESTSRS
jgi:hypothetical protein